MLLCKRSPTETGMVPALAGLTKNSTFMDHNCTAPCCVLECFRNRYKYAYENSISYSDCKAIVEKGFRFAVDPVSELCRR